METGLAAISGDLDASFARAAIDAASVGLALIGRDGSVRHANRELTRLLGSAVGGWEAFPAVVRELAAGPAPSADPAPSAGPVTVAQAGRRVEWTVTALGRDGWLVQARDMTILDQLHAAAELATHRLRTVALLHRHVVQMEFDTGFDQIVTLILDHARDLISAGAIGVGRIEGDEIVYWVATAPGMVGIRTPLRASLSGICIATGETAVCQDTELDTRVDRVATRTAGVRSMIIVPLWHGGQIVGVINVVAPHVNAYDADDVHTVELVAGAVAAAYGHAADLAAKRALLDELHANVEALRESESRLAHAALHDPLTGLPNRTLFRDRLQHALAGAHREGRSAAVLFIDVDHFKEINDNLGHEAGDLLLCEIADRLRTCLRSAETAARLGGDEFVVLAMGLHGPADARRLAQRITACLAQPVTLSGVQIRPSASIGVAMNHGADDTPDRITNAADVALYEAKRQGRGRFRLSAT